MASICYYVYFMMSGHCESYQVVEFAGTMVYESMRNTMACERDNSRGPQSLGNRCEDSRLRGIPFQMTTQSVILTSVPKVGVIADLIIVLNWHTWLQLELCQLRFQLLVQMDRSFSCATVALAKPAFLYLVAQNSSPTLRQVPSRLDRKTSFYRNCFREDQ